MLSDLPEGASCFVDANIICYHIIETPLLSDECARFIKRIEHGTVRAATSAAVVAEAIHKVMLAEAIQQHRLDHRGLAHRLQRQRDLIAGLSEHRKVPKLIKALFLHVEPVTLDTLDRAVNISTQYRLLTNDAVTIAIMEKLGSPTLSQTMTISIRFPACRSGNRDNSLARNPSTRPRACTGTDWLCTPVQPRSLTHYCGSEGSQLRK
jgi:predicted nucleic acid-binding protein